MNTQHSGLDKFIDIFIEEYYIIFSIPAAPLLSMRNSVGFYFYGSEYGIYKTPAYL